MKRKQKYQVKLIFFKNKKQTQEAKQKQIYLEVLKVCLSYKTTPTIDHDLAV